MPSAISSYFNNTFHSLRYSNFRKFFIGQCFSLTGTWMQRTAELWLVYTLTKSPFLVGLFGVCQFLPMLALSLFVGVFVDRFPKKRIVLFTQFLFTAQALAMTVLTYTHLLRYWQLLVLAAVFGVAQTIDLPARQAFFFDLVGKDDIMNAVSLNSVITNLAKVVGPAISAIVLVRFGAVSCFMANDISFVFVIAGLLMIRVKPAVRKPAERRRMMSEVAGGLSYIKNSEMLLVTTLLFAIVSTFAMNNEVIIPVFADVVLHRGADGYSTLLTAAGVGSFLGAFVIANLSKRGVRIQFLVYGAVVTSLLQLLTFFIHSYGASFAVLVGIGFTNLTLIPTVNTIYQLYSTKEYRGRVLSVYSLLNQGSTPVGNFFAGSVMQSFGGDSGFVSCGLVSLVLLLPVLFIKRRTIAAMLRKPAAGVDTEKGGA